MRVLDELRDFTSTLNLPSIFAYYQQNFLSSYCSYHDKLTLNGAADFDKITKNSQITFAKAPRRILIFLFVLDNSEKGNVYRVYKKTQYFKRLILTLLAENILCPWEFRMLLFVQLNC